MMQIRNRFSPRLFWNRLKEVETALKPASLTPARIVLLSFLGIITLGTVMLMLPAASTGKPLGLIDALFTATSATCVTGLIVVDTGSAFTPFGQAVILGLIQVGGLGIMTFYTFFMYVMGSRLSMSHLDILHDTYTQQPTHRWRGVLRTVVVATISIELIGAAILASRFAFQMPAGQAIYYGIFHAISAFCNAGFALFPDSFVAYQHDPLVNITLMVLIILGGLGFVVVYELSRLWRNPNKKLSLHSRLVFFVSAGLIAAGALAVFVLEYQNTLAGLPLSSKIFASIFQSVTARTAGFNTLDMSHISNPALFVLIILMIIGASPGSTGGGVKTTTFIVNLSFIVSRFRNQDHVHLFKRRIPDVIVARSVSIAFFALVIIIVGTILLLGTELAEISHLESRGMFLEMLFEVSSAFATVGLSMGVTPTLSPEGKLIITILMYIGRVGPLTLALALGHKEKVTYKLAEENVLVG